MKTLLVLLLLSQSREIIEADVDASSVIRYLLSHEKPNGAFGPAGHRHTDVAWNYPAVHALLLLGQDIPRPDDCFRQGSGAVYRQPGSHDVNRAWDLYQRAMLASVLGRKDESERPGRGAWTLEFRDRKGKYYFKIPDKDLAKRVAPFCDIPTLAYFVQAVTASEGTISNPEAAVAHLSSRQLVSGAFVDAYRVPPDPSEAHVVATSQAVIAFARLGKPVPRAAECAEWLRSCQTDSGGFRWSPSDSSPSNKPDVWYTWAALRALEVLGRKPRDPEACLNWINSLQTPEGGFGDRPGWNARIYSTYYAVHALHLLSGDASKAVRTKKATARRTAIPPDRYRIFQAHLKSPPGGADMVEAVRGMGFNLLGVKDNSPGTKVVPVVEAARYAAGKEYPLVLLSCPEQYAYRLKWFGGHPANHVANFLVPSDFPKARLSAIDRAGREELPWKTFRTQVIAPLLEAGTLFYPELDYEMTNAYMVYDDGLDGGPGYNAVIGGLGWPNWDWIRFFPYRERWVGKLPIIVDGDAHGDIKKWGDRLERQRVLYLAERHDLEGFLDACRNGRTVCVIRGGKDKTEMAYYGDASAVAEVRRRESEWRWWKP